MLPFAPVYSPLIYYWLRGVGLGYGVLFFTIKPPVRFFDRLTKPRRFFKGTRSPTEIPGAIRNSSWGETKTDDASHDLTVAPENPKL